MYRGLEASLAGRLCDSASSGISPDSRPNGDTQLAEKQCKILRGEKNQGVLFP